MSRKNNNSKNKSNYVTRVFEHLKSGNGVAILTLIFTALGYAFMSGYNEYFGVGMSFYKLNVFNDFFSIIMVSLILSIPILFSYLISTFLLSLICNFDDIKSDWEKGNTIAFIFAIVILTIVAFIWYKYFCNLYEINDIKTFKTFGFVFALGLALPMIIFIVDKYIKKYFNNDIIDLIFVLIIIISLFLVSYNSIQKFGKEVAGEKRTFMIIDNKYAVLYSTSDYAIVTIYETNESNRGVFYIMEKFKIDLNNRNISYRTFDSYIIFKNRDYCICI